MYSESQQQAATRTQNFTYHAPLPNQPERYTLIREAANNLAHLCNVNCPPSRELSVAMTKLEEAVVVLEHPGKLSEEARAKMRSSWVQMFGAGGQGEGVAVLQEGMKVTCGRLRQSPGTKNRRLRSRPGGSGTLPQE